MPSVREWEEYNRTALNRPDYVLTGDNGGELLPNTRSGFYLLASYMPALSLRLTQPDLSWCIDGSLFEKQQTRICVGSSYFVTEKCVLGPLVHYSEASIDERVKMFVKSFAGEVANGLRWILQIYRTTNIMEQRDLFNMELEVAKNMRNKLAFERYTPLQLVAELGETSECEIMDVETSDEPFYRQQFGYTTGVAAPIGSLGQFARPRLGASAVTGFCNMEGPNLVVNDPYVLKEDDKRRLRELMVKNHEVIANDYFNNIFRPMSGMAPGVGSAQRIRPCQRKTTTSAGGTNTATLPGNVPNPTSIQPTTLSRPQEVPLPPTVAEETEDVSMDELMATFTT